MSKKKNKLKLEIGFDFDLIGIITSVKEYKLAWIINQCDSCEFIKSKDLEIDFVGSKNISISNYTFNTAYTNIFLLKNRLVFNNAQTDHYLIPELKRFDFFVKIDGESELFPTNAILATLKESNNIEYVTILDPNNLKQKENLIF